MPVFEKIHRHLTKLRRAGIDGAMLGWTLGGFPSPTLQMAHLILDAPGVAAAEEAQLDTLRAFVDGYAAKVARGLDIMWKVNE